MNSVPFIRHFNIFILARRKAGYFSEDSDEGIAVSETDQCSGFINVVVLFEKFFAFLYAQAVDVFQEGQAGILLENA